MPREFDILILGATGFSGRLIARYLEKHPERSKIRYGIAGRSQNKLKALAKDLNLGTNVALVEVDISNYDELEAHIKRTRLLINCVGPFVIYSSPIVHACARTGTHYTDITGEAPWILKMIREYDYLAFKNKAIIIPASGIDSVPSDLSVYLSVRTAKRTFGPTTTLSWSRTGIYMGGSPSGGTAATAITLFDGTVRRKDAIDSQRQWAFSPVKGKYSSRRLVYTLPFSNWIGGTSLMGFVNIPIVQRTWGLNELRYRSLSISSAPNASLEAQTVPYAGPNFTYVEFAQTKKFGKLGAWLWSMGMIIFFGLLMPLAPMRWLVKKFGPAAGSGPSDEVMSKRFVNLVNVTAVETNPPKYVKTEQAWKGDAYLVTAITIVEASLSIVLDFEKLPKLGQEGGLLTPMSALGDVFVDRLERTGRFVQHSEVVSDIEAENKKII